MNQTVDISDPVFRRAIYDAHNGLCFYTGRPININDMHIDHIVPVNLGGEYEIDNLVPTTSDINLGKQDKINDLTERMVFINKTVFAPRVEAIYSQSEKDWFDKKCTECGMMFKARTSKAKYCSDDCRRARTCEALHIKELEEERKKEAEYRSKMKAYYEKRLKFETEKLNITGDSPLYDTSIELDRLGISHEAQN